MKRIYFLSILLCIGIASYSQVAGDYRTKATGNWDETGGEIWETWDGSMWIDATALPSSTTNIFIEGTNTVNVNVNAVINDLNITTGSGTRLAIAANITLQVAGKIRGYTGAAPGVDASNPQAIIITSGALGKLQFIGVTRTIQVGGQWGSNPRNFSVDFALDAGAIGTITNSFKAGDITISSGTIICNNDLRADFNADNTGSITVKTGTILRIGGNISRVGIPATNSQIGSFILETGATLEYAGTVGYIDAQTITLNGLVSYTSSTAQTLVDKPASPADGTIPNVYNDLTLQTSAKTLATNITVNGILSMRTGNSAAPSLSLGTGPFTLTYGSAATLQYRGISAGVSQTTGSTEWPDAGSSASIPSKVDIFNQYNVLLNGNKSITGEIKLSGNTGVNSKVILGNNNLIVGSINRPNPDVNKYIVTDGDGKFTLPNIGSSPALFPVGPSTTLYHPATITNAGVIDSFSVKVNSNPVACADATKTVNATWNITEAAIGGSDCTISLDYTGAATGALYSALGGEIVDCGSVAPYYANGTVTGTVATGSGFTSFSPFGITSDFTIVPITLQYFNGKRKGNNVNLTWATATELNAKGFDVQRSFDGVNYSNIAFVAAVGNSTSTKLYNYTDANVTTKAYYRLKQVDNNNQSKLSTVVTISGNDARKLDVEKVYVANNNGKTIIALHSPKQQQVKIVVYNMQGAKVFEQSKNIVEGYSNITLELATLQKGIYNVVVISENERLSKQF